MVIGYVKRPLYLVDGDLKRAAEAEGLYCSFVNSEVYSKYDADTFKEALVDWGFFGVKSNRAAWM